MNELKTRDYSIPSVPSQNCVCEGQEISKSEAINRLLEPVCSSLASGLIVLSKEDVEEDLRDVKCIHFNSYLNMSPEEFMKIKIDSTGFKGAILKIYSPSKEDLTMGQYGYIASQLKSLKIRRGIYEDVRSAGLNLEVYLYK